MLADLGDEMDSAKIRLCFKTAGQFGRDWLRGFFWGC